MSGRWIDARKADDTIIRSGRAIVVALVVALAACSSTPGRSSAAIVRAGPAEPVGTSELALGRRTVPLTLACDGLLRARHVQVEQSRQSTNGASCRMR